MRKKDKKPKQKKDTLKLLKGKGLKISKEKQLSIKEIKELKNKRNIEKVERKFPEGIEKKKKWKTTKKEKKGLKRIKSLIRKEKKKKRLKPQILGICFSVDIIKPRKPNSAQRKIVKVMINNKIIKIKIPGIGHNLNSHSEILFSPSRTRDCPGVKYRVIRGAKDASSVDRKTSRSKYGTKKKK